mmetsp:Transcript_1635/g.3443  ORF Transcript_1635/g.3443 Transcript_1635/m.3443 type:complete len:97 (-) Transcript_1635:2-292(-)
MATLVVPLEDAFPRLDSEMLCHRHQPTILFNSMLFGCLPAKELSALLCSALQAKKASFEGRAIWRCPPRSCFKSHQILAKGQGRSSKSLMQAISTR